MKHARARCRHEIICVLLETTQEGELATNILYAIRQTYKRTKELLQNLNDNGLVEKRGTRWFTTEKGKHFIEAFQALQKLSEGGEK